MAGFNPKFHTVFTDEYGRHLLVSPDGKEVYGVIMTRTTDDCGAPAEVLVKMFCNLTATKDEAIQKYNEAANKEASKA